MNSVRLLIEQSIPLHHQVFKKHEELLFWAKGIAMLSWILAIVLPFVFWNSASQDGYPWAPHIIFGVYCFAVAIFELHVAFTVDREKAMALDGDCCCHECGWICAILYHLVMGMISRADVYTDGTFLVVAYHTPDTKLFGVALIIYIVGMVTQLLLPLGMICGCSGYEHEVDLNGVSHTNEIKFTWAIRSGELHLIMNLFGVSRPGIEAERDIYISGFRFLFEDLPQTVIQVLFLLEKHQSSSNRELIAVSITIGICLSMKNVLSAAYVFYCKNPSRRVIKKDLRIPPNCI